VAGHGEEKKWNSCHSYPAFNQYYWKWKMLTAKLFKSFSLQMINWGTSYTVFADLWNLVSPKHDENMLLVPSNQCLMWYMASCIDGHQQFLPHWWAMSYYYQLWSSHFHGEQLKAIAQFPSKEVHCIVFLTVICKCNSQVKLLLSLLWPHKIICIKFSFTLMNRNGEIYTLTADIFFCMVVMWKRL
jgi:hypothetical protein